MEITFTQAQLNTLTDNGISMDDLRNSVAAYRQQGYSDEDIQRGLWGTIKQLNPHALNPVEFEERNKENWPKYVERLKSRGLAVPEYDDSISYTQRVSEAQKAIGADNKVRSEKNARYGRNLERGAAFVDSFGSALTLGMHDLFLKGIDKLTGEDNVGFAKEMREKHPGYAIGGTIAGYITPGGAASYAMKGVNYLANGAKAGIAGVATFKGGQTLAGASKLLINAVGTQAMFQVHETAKQLAETGEFVEGDKALQEFGNGTMLNAGVDLAFQTVGGVAGKIANVTSRTRKAVNVLGGEANVAKGQAAHKAVLANGGTQEEAAAAFFGAVMEDLPVDKRKIFEKMLANNEEFAKITQQQMAGAGGVVEDSINALTKPEYGKLSHSLLENLWGATKNEMGTYEIDFTKKGLDRLLGLDNSQKVLQMRKEGLVKAEKKVMNDASLASEVRSTFNELRDELVTNGSRDLERAANMVEQGTLKSFEGSVAQQEALARAQERIANKTQELMASGRQMTKAEADDIVMAELRSGAKKHFKETMANGTDSVMDINDIKEFFKTVDENAVKSGQAEAFGAFNEGVNTRILDQLDETLYKANQAQRFGKTLGDMHDFGRKYSPDRFNELESALNNGISAEEKAVKLSAFKMGLLDRVTDAAVAGDVHAVEQLRTMMTQGKLKPYFTTEEIGAYMDIVRPKVEAARNINSIMAATLKGTNTSPDVMAPAVRAMVSGAASGVSSNTFLNSLVTIAQRTVTPYGRGVARRIQELATNPDWKTFNKIAKQTTDLAEKRAFNQMVAEAMQTMQQMVKPATQAIAQGEYK